MEIKRAAVIGSGVMGSGIAAHFANAGVQVLLLDIVPAGVPANAADRSALARQAIERMLKTEPAPFMHPRNAKLVTPGNLEDDLGRLAEVDWIVEAIVEQPEAKQALYARIDAVRRPGSIVSSNTSTIPLEMLVQGRPASFAADFLIAHFFNPPRYMRLLELVAGPATRPDAAAAVRDFADRRLGKGVVRCKDTPGFIANRIGTFWIQAAVNAARDLGLTVEEADAVCGRPMGIPKTGVFGLIDLVGLDLMPAISRSLLATLPADDPYRALQRDWPLAQAMIADGRIGRKGKGGFYRLNRAGGGKVKEAIDLETGTYRPAGKPELASVEAARAGLRALVEHPDRGGRFAWAVVSRTLAYAASLVPAIADEPAAVDQAMRLGYNWKYGPFELIDQLGSSWFADRLAADGQAVPALLREAGGKPFYAVTDGRPMQRGVDGSYRPLERPEGVLLLADVKRTSEPVRRNGSAVLWDIGDGVLCLEFTTKMNTLDGDVLAMLADAITLVGQGVGRWRGLVIYSDADNFSVGANLGMALFAINVALWPEISRLVEDGQKTYMAMKYAAFPIVAAPAGMALGGGCEMILHAGAVQAHAEAYIGLVEAGVGLVPGWGGCTELLARHSHAPGRPGGPMPPVAAAFETISLAKVSRSAAEARELGFLRPGDGITMNRDRLLADAKARVLELAKDYRPPVPPELRLPGPSGRAALNLMVDTFRALGRATPHDAVVAGQLAMVLSGGDADPTMPVGEDKILALEAQAFMALVRQPATIDRIEHMLDTGKPLRN